MLINIIINENVFPLMNSQFEYYRRFIWLVLP